MAALGRLNYRYFEAPGVTLDLDIGAFADHFTVAVSLNGVETRKARRRAMSDAHRWGVRTADELMSLLNLQPQLGFGDALGA